MTGKDAAKLNQARHSPPPVSKITYKTIAVDAVKLKEYVGITINQRYNIHNDSLRVSDCSKTSGEGMSNDRVGC